jgi:hypothetical protein
MSRATRKETNEQAIQTVWAPQGLHDRTEVKPFVTIRSRETDGLAFERHQIRMGVIVTIRS